MNDKQTTVLRADSLCAFYGGTQVLTDISFGAQKGTITALLGPNGSGKSTLLRLLAGLAQSPLQFTGSIQLQGQDITSLSRKKLAEKAAYMAQSEHNAWSYTVFDAVLAGRFVHSRWYYTKEDERIAHEKISLLELEPLVHRPINTLSGGEFQRTVLARVLAQESGLLLLDEPVSSLDTRHQYILLKTVKRIVETQKLSVIVSLHDINLASLFADRILLLKNGHLYAQGTPEELITPQILRQIYDISFGLFTHPQENVPQVYVENIR